MRMKKFKNLKDERERRGYSLEATGNRINISKSSYFNKEKGTHDFTYTEMKKLSLLFNQSLDYLFEEEKAGA